MTFKIYVSRTSKNENGIIVYSDQTFFKSTRWSILITSLKELGIIDNTHMDEDEEEKEQEFYLNNAKFITYKIYIYFWIIIYSIGNFTS